MSLYQRLSEFYPPRPKFTEQNLPDLCGKIYLITGGTSGIGLALAKILYSKNAKVYITTRTASSAEKAITEIKSTSPTSTGALDFLPMDLTDLTQIAPAVREFLKKETLLHSVWFNAGVMNVPVGSQTKQGYELQWGTNVVAHFLISQLLMPVLVATAKVAPKGSVRAVWVSSDGHINFSPAPDGLDWEDLEKKKGSLSPMSSYGQNKVGNVLLAKETAVRYGKNGIVAVVSCLPLPFSKTFVLIIHRA
jgi:NAD(P)-dependent dehydrogenase (short-subunit alcohol dehydrogenase family)